MSLKFSFKHLLLAAFTVCVFINPLAVKSQQKYNVLFIALDDMNERADFLGSSYATTPNLHRLLARGMNFTRAYDQFPLCSPSRTSLLVGWRPDSTKIYNDKTRPRDSLGPNVVMLPEYFRNNGYHTERYGKILHGTYENDCKWDYAEPPERKDGGLLPNGGGSSNSSNASESAAAADGSWWIFDVADSVDEDGMEARHLVARMKQPVTQPFFYAYGTHIPHNPFTPSLKYWNLEGDSSVQQVLPIDESGTLGDTGNGSGNIVLPNTPPNDRADVPDLAFNGHPIVFKTDDDWRNTIHAYDAQMRQVDSSIGLILNEMDRQNLWDNTVVVLWSDHGQHLGEHQGLWKKMTLFKESLHVPLIVCVPGKQGNSSCSRLVENVDLYPTLAQLCGLAPPPDMQGTSFAPLIDNPSQPWKRAAFSQLRRDNGGADKVVSRSVFTERYHYNYWDTAQEELYDRYNDSNEYTNLVTNIEYANVLDTMRGILAAGWTASLPGWEILPSAWGNFTAEKVNNTSVLKWSTLSEHNADRFVVERTIDGRNYTVVADVKATGNSTNTHNYYFTDLKPVKGNNIYRIRLIDKDGKYNYSESRSLTFNDAANLISVAPNPARNTIFLTVKDNHKTLQVKLFNSLGMQVGAYTLSGESMPIDISRFAKGGYYITITGEAVNHKEKLIIQ